VSHGFYCFYEYALTIETSQSPGYEALHPELKGINPEDYPDIAKMRILGDIAPYSREYQKYAARTCKQAENDPELLAEYERIASAAFGLLSFGGYFGKKLFTAINAGLDSIEQIKQVQTIQAENHLKTIQDASLVTRDETIKTNAKLDVLIGILERK
jgi:hypothetical protein